MKEHPMTAQPISRRQVLIHGLPGLAGLSLPGLSVMLKLQRAPD